MELEAQIQKDRAMLKKDSEKMSRCIVEAFEKLVKEDEILIPEIKNVPTGKKAAEEAMPDLERFISENKFGLYRGEALLLLADYSLERALEPEKALSAYNSAVKWLEEGRKTKAEIEKMQVPAKALKVALPPPTMHSYDEWGNMNWSEPAPGNVVNQFTCPWYFDWLELSILSKRGLCHNILGNKEQALEDIKVIIQNSPEEKKNFEGGWFNSYSRLKSEFEQDRKSVGRERVCLYV